MKSIVWTVGIMVLLWLALVLITSPGDIKRPSNTDKLYPELTPTLKAALQSATVCDDPAIAEPSKVGPDFTYGCFCGRSHPEYKHKSGVHFTKLGKADRLDLVAKFYADKPVDQIDKTCRDHDVCWLYQGSHTSECNAEFMYQLSEVKKALVKAGADSKDDSAEKHCAEFADNLAAIFATHLIKEDYDGLGEAARTGFNKALMTPLVLIEGISELLFAQATETSIMPTPGEKCVLPGWDPVMPPTVEPEG